MSNVFKLFICILLFTELLLIDGCKYYDGQRVRLKDLKKDELNGKYGIINNQNNKNEARCGVLIDGETEPKAIKFENLDKIPTIFIHGEIHDLANDKQLYHFITQHKHDKIGLEYGINSVKEYRKYGLITNVFGFDDTHAKHRITWYDADTEAKSEWKESMIQSILFSDDELFNELQERVNMDLQEWRDFNFKYYCLGFFHSMFGHYNQFMSTNTKELQQFKELQKEVLLKLERIQRDMGYEDERESIEKFQKSGLKQEKWDQIVHTWLEIVKKYLINKMKNDAFVDFNKYGFIFTETLHEYVNIFKTYYHSKGQEQMRNMAIVRDVIASKEIVKEYAVNYNKGSNVYVFIGNAHVKELKCIIEQRLSMVEDTPDVHVAITEIFPEWKETDEFREEYFQYFLDRTGQTESDCVIQK